MRRVILRYCSCVLAIVFLFSILLIPANAVVIDTELENGLQIQELNDLNVRFVINRYFSQRLEYLNGNSDSIVGAVTAISTDEASHKAVMEQAGISLIQSSIVIDSIACWDYTATATVTETATFLIEEESVQEIISHTLIVSIGLDNTLIVWDDGYEEITSDFISCSYVPPEMQLPVELNSPSINAVPCLVAVAYSEIGTTETSSGWTKYGAWYDAVKNTSGFAEAAWCASFVAWCANQASVSTSVIPCYASTTSYRTYFSGMSRYYLSRSQGGTYTPQPGDLFFQGDAADAPTHIGIVHYVSGNYVYLIDGNCENKVNTHCFSLTASSIVGYAHPNYTYTSHQYPTTWSTSSTHHWYTCRLCGIGTKNKAAHTLQTDNLSGETYCTVCSYGRTGVMSLPKECEHIKQ